MEAPGPAPSPRKAELAELAYRYALEHGLGDLSLRPLAAAVGSSPRVLLFLFGSKEGLLRALLERARAEELAGLDRLRREHPAADLAGAASELWSWLSDPAHRSLLGLWVEAYGRSLVDPAGPWGGFAARTVDDWLALLARFQPRDRRRSAAGRAERAAALAVLRGGLLDLLATGEVRRVSAGVEIGLGRVGRAP